MFKKASLVVSGAIAGAALVLCIGAAGETKAEPRYAHLQVVTYSSGLTGFFDTKTGELFVYDSNMEKCYAKRRLMGLGKPLKKL